MTLQTLEGTHRYLITRCTTAEADLYEAIPREFKETITEVHFANGEDPELLGQQGTYGIDLDEEWLARIRGESGFQRPSNLIDVVEVDPERLGENVDHTTSEVIEPLIWKTCPSSRRLMRPFSQRTPMRRRAHTATTAADPFSTRDLRGHVRAFAGPTS